MIYPEFIRERDTIGVSAPSAGLTKPLRINTLNNAVKKFEEKGYKILLTPNVRKNEDGVSSSATIRSLELASLYQNKDVKAIICATGGEFLVEMLSCFDFVVLDCHIVSCLDTHYIFQDKQRALSGNMEIAKFLQS